MMSMTHSEFSKKAGAHLPSNENQNREVLFQKKIH
jgi:hypothetical protein